MGSLPSTSSMRSAAVELAQHALRQIYVDSLNGADHFEFVGEVKRNVFSPSGHFGDLVGGDGWFRCFRHRLGGIDNGWLCTTDIASLAQIRQASSRFAGARQ